MTEQALDQLARRVMLDAARLEYGEVLEELPEHAFSPAFERKMKRLLRRGRHPAWHRTLRAAACVLLALILSGCAVLAVSPEAREAFTGWVREVYENAFVYRFYGEKQEDRELLQETETFCRPAWVPEGYRIIHATVEDRLTFILYRDDSKSQIAFTCFKNGGTVQVSGEGVYQTARVNGRSADLYIDRNPEEANVLTWTDASGESIFSITGVLSGEELVKIAESVEVVSPDRRPAWVPEGYVLYERSFLNSDAYTVTIYENREGEAIIFRCQPNGDAGRLYLTPNEGSVEKRVSVNGHPADLYSNPEPGRISELCWSDGEAFYYLSGSLSDGEILKIAESVQKLPPIPATHIPTWLPPGYRDTSTSSGLWSREAEYENEAGEQLQFRFARHGQVEEPMEECLKAIREAVAGLEGQDVLIDGCPGRLYPDAGGVNHLIWGPEGAEEVYWLSAPLSGEVLMEIAGRVNRTAE